MTAEIQYLTPLIGGLYGLYVAFGMWDGATRRVVFAVSRSAARLGVEGGWNAELIKVIKEESGIGDGSKPSGEAARFAYKIYDGVTGAIRAYQNYCFLVAAFYALVLLFAWIYPGHRLPVLETVAVGLLLLVPPIVITVFFVRRHWRRWEDSKDGVDGGPGADTGIGGKYDGPQKP